MAIILETERLILRTWLLNDLDDYFKIYGDSKVCRYIDPKGVLKNKDAARRPLQRENTYQHEHGFCHWAVVAKRVGRVIGACGFHLRPASEELVLSFAFAQLYWGKGYAPEAARACLRYASENLNAPMVIASIDSENGAAQRVLEKIGFVRQRHSRPDDRIQDFYFDLKKSDAG